MGKPSRKRFQEALRALKAACKNDRLPFTLRVHAAELILAVYGVPLPDSNLRTKRAVRDLVEENAFERSLRQQVHERVLQDAESQARAFLERVNNTQEKQ